MRLAPILAVISLGLVTAAVAEPSEADKKKIAAAIAKGRELEGKGKHAEAIAAYEQALKLSPDDELANAELGWAAYMAKDYTRAEAATRLAIAHGHAPQFKHDVTSRPRGAALYNLGLIQEAQKKPDEAAQSYAESLQARGSRAVREKLQKLDPKRAAERDPLAPVKLVGPEKEVRELCRGALRRMQVSPDENWGDHNTCTNNGDVFQVGKKQLAKPFEDVYGYTTVDRTDLELAVKVNGQWYGGRLEGKQSRGSGHCGGTQFTFPRATVTERQGVKILEVAYTSSGGCSHDGNNHSRVWGWDESGVIYIGVAASGTPGQTPPIPLTMKEWSQLDDQAKMTDGSAAMTVAWPPAGGLDIAGKLETSLSNPRYQGDPADLDPEDFLGHHLLAFP